MRTIGGIERVHAKLQRELLRQPEVTLDVGVDPVQSVAANAIDVRGKTTGIEVRGRALRVALESVCVEPTVQGSGTCIDGLDIARIEASPPIQQGSRLAFVCRRNLLSAVQCA